MRSALPFASRAAFILMVFLLALPAVAIPFASIPYEIQKGAVAALVIGTFTVLGTSAFLLSKRTVQLHFAPEMLSALPFLVIGIISTFGHPLSTAIFGAAFEAGTVGAAGLVVLAILFPALLPSGRYAHYVINGFILAGATTGTYVLVGLIYTREIGETLVGSWQHTGFIAILTYIAAVVCATTARGYVRVLYYVAGAVSLAVFSAMFVPEAAVVGGIVLVAVGLMLHLKLLNVERGLDDQIVLLTFGIAAAGLLAASLIATVIKLDRPIEPVPSLIFTELVIGSQYVDSFRQALVGTGESYAYAFNKYRTNEVNESPFWNRAPESAGSVVLDIASSRGLLGLLAFLVIPASLWLALWRMRRSSLADGAVIAAAAIAAGSIALMLVTDTGIVVALVGATTIGLVHRINAKEVSISRVGSSIAIVVAMLLLVFGATITVVAARQLLAAEFFFRVSGQNFTQGDAAVQFLELATRSWSTPQYEMAAARAIFITDFTDARAEGASPSELVAALDRVVTHADRAGDIGSNDVSAVLFRASVYTTLIPLGYDGAAEKAEQSLNLAESLSRNLPEIYYLRSVLAYNRGATDVARNEIRKAIRLKPDYAEAVEFEQRLEPAEVN